MKTKTPDHVEIRIPPRAEFVRVVRMAACAVASQMDFTYDVLKDVELAVGEACNNAVEHVVAESSEEIIVRFSMDADQLAMEVIDRGKGFELTESPNRAPVEDDDWDKPGGLGLVVIRELMDEMSVDCSSMGTCVRMVKYRATR